MELQKAFPEQLDRQGPLSYGPCQFPTLGFVVEQYRKRKRHVPEDFWQIAGQSPVLTGDTLGALAIWRNERLHGCLGAASFGRPLPPSQGGW
jgi:DNA topoisomerase IA